MKKEIKITNKLIGYGYENFFKDVNDKNIELYHKYLFDLIMESDHFITDYEVNINNLKKKNMTRYIFLMMN